MDHVSRLHCSLCDKSVPADRAMPVRALRPSLRAYMEGKHNRSLEETDELCQSCLLKFRKELLLTRLERERGALSQLELDVAEKAAGHESVAMDLFATFERKATAGQRLADSVARVGGSWPFVTSFLTFLGIWMVFNHWLHGRAFDPYPFILLNLVLSCLAALQAPIIMMSQNRTSARDRLQADLDFRINLKAELEIAMLHEKMDHLLHDQWESMLEMQQAQLDLISELGPARRSMTPPPHPSQ